MVHEESRKVFKNLLLFLPEGIKRIHVGRGKMVPRAKEPESNRGKWYTLRNGLQFYDKKL